MFHGNLQTYIRIRKYSCKSDYRLEAIAGQKPIKPTEKKEERTARKGGNMELPIMLQVLRDRDIWLNYVLTRRPNGLHGKPPINPRNLKAATITDPDNLTDYDTAARNIGKEVHAYGGTYAIAGVGISLGAAGIVGIDLDHVIRMSPAGSMSISPQAIQIIRDMKSYYEFSPSGDGIHILALSGGYRLPEDCKHKVEQADGTVFEIYDSGRHFTITGNIQAGCPCIAERPGEIRHLAETIFAGSSSVGFVGLAGSSGSSRSGPIVGVDYSGKLQITTPDDTPLPMTDEDAQLWRRMWANRQKGSEIKRLFEGGIYDDRSRNDLAILNHLAYWTHCDEERMIRMYLETNLDHSKWNSYESYRRHTLDAAINGTMRITRKRK